MKNDNELISLYGTTKNPDILEIIINKYLPLLKSLAQNHCKKYLSTTFDDSLQNAKLGTIIAIKRFRIEQSINFATYLKKSIYFYLLSCNDNESLIKCPAHMRGKRNQFVAGGITSILTPDYVELSDYEVSGESQIVSGVYARIFIQSLKDDYRAILDLLLQGYSISAVAQTVGDKERNIRKKVCDLRTAYSV